MTRFSPQYLGYMRSASWKLRRQRALYLADFRCQVCGGKARLEVHHVTYVNLGHEQDADLTVLCWHCHRWHEFGKRLRRLWGYVGKFWNWVWN